MSCNNEFDSTYYYSIQDDDDILIIIIFCLLTIINSYWLLSLSARCRYDIV